MPRNLWFGRGRAIESNSSDWMPGFLSWKMILLPINSCSPSLNSRVFEHEDKSAARQQGRIIYRAKYANGTFTKAYRSLMGKGMDFCEKPNDHYILSDLPVNF